ncbi:ATP synthase subunit delta [Nitrospira sp.]|nr:ATP synthase subunit delta [Nitrospira sp.]
MKKSSVARRYAKALLELLDPGSVGPTRTALTALGTALTESTQLQHVLASPAFSLDEKSGVLTALGQQAGCPRVGLNFLSQLVKTNRALFLPEIAQAFGEFADRSKGTQHVEIRSAAPLDSVMQESLKAKLKSSLKREVDVALRVDPTLVAGIQIHIGSTVYDSSVRNRLDTMQSLLMRE